MAPTLTNALRTHWQEYLIEGWALGTFMLCAGLVATLLQIQMPVDLWYWQVNLCGAAPSAFEAALRDSHAALLSVGTVELVDAQLGWSKGVLAGDPDGHASLIGEGQPCTRTW